MKAVLHKKYGPPDVLFVTHVDKPKPKKNEVMVKIKAATVTSGDARLRASNFPAPVWLIARCIFGLFKPKKKILGHELAGVVEEIGDNVTKFKVGDEIFGTTTMRRGGSYAEYICLPQQWKDGVIELKPNNVNFDEAAAIPIGGMTALFLLEKAKIASGQNVLVYGASGSVGTFAIQLATVKGGSVSAVCSAKNSEMVQNLGAKSVIDYNTADYSQMSQKYDIIFDAVGKASKKNAKKVLTRGGRFVSVNMLTTEKASHLLELKSLAEEGLLKPFIDQHFPLEKIVEAHNLVDSGRKRGNVVIDIDTQK